MDITTFIRAMYVPVRNGNKEIASVRTKKQELGLKYRITLILKLYKNYGL